MMQKKKMQKFTPGLVEGVEPLGLLIEHPHCSLGVLGPVPRRCSEIYFESSKFCFALYLFARGFF